MDKNKLKQLEPKISKVIELAREENNNGDNQEDDGEFIYGELIRKGMRKEYLNRKVGGKESKLRNYLMNLNEKEVRDICILMYLGRDYSKERLREGNNDILYYWEKRGCTNPKDILVHRMVSKFPLGDYLNFTLDNLDIYN